MAQLTKEQQQMRQRLYKDAVDNNMFTNGKVSYEEFNRRIDHVSDYVDKVADNYRSHGVDLGDGNLLRQGLGAPTSRQIAVRATAQKIARQQKQQQQRQQKEQQRAAKQRREEDLTALLFGMKDTKERVSGGYTPSPQTKVPMRPQSYMQDVRSMWGPSEAEKDDYILAGRDLVENTVDEHRRNQPLVEGTSPYIAKTVGEYEDDEKKLWNADRIDKMAKGFVNDFIAKREKEGHAGDVGLNDLATNIGRAGNGMNMVITAQEGKRFNEVASPEALWKALDTDETRKKLFDMFVKEKDKEGKTALDKAEKQAKARGISLEDYIRGYAMPAFANSITSAFEGNMSERYKVKDYSDYLSRKFADSLIGSIADMSTTTRQQRQRQEQAMAEAEQNLTGWERAGGTVANLLGQMPEMIGTGGIGGALVKGGAKVVGRQILGRIAPRIGTLIANGGNTMLRAASENVAEKFGRWAIRTGYGMANGMAGMAGFMSEDAMRREISTGEDPSFASVAKAGLSGAGEGAKTGVLFGVAGIPGRYLTNAAGKIGNTALRTLSKTSAQTFSVATEAGVMTGQEYAEWLKQPHGKDEQFDLTGSMLNSLAMVATFKGQHLVQQYFPALGARVEAYNKAHPDHKTNAAKMVCADFVNLFSGKTGKMPVAKVTDHDKHVIETATGKTIEQLGASPETLNEVFSNKQIPWNVRQKIALDTFNTMEVSRPRTQSWGISPGEKGGYYLTEYDREGNPIEQHPFKSMDEHDAVLGEIVAKRDNDDLLSYIGMFRMGLADRHDDMSAKERDNEVFRRTVTAMGFDYDLMQTSKEYDDMVRARIGGDDKAQYERERYKQERSLPTRDEEIISQFAADNGMTDSDVKKIIFKDPLSRTEDEQALIDRLSQTMHDEIFRQNELHRAQSAQDGAMVADKGVDITDPESAGAIYATLSKTVKDSVDKWNKLCSEIPELAAIDGFENGRPSDNPNRDNVSPEQFTDNILDSSLSDADKKRAVEAFAEMQNASAVLDGFTRQCSVNLINTRVTTEAQVFSSSKDSKITDSGGNDLSGSLVSVTFGETNPDGTPKTYYVKSSSGVRFREDGSVDRDNSDPHGMVVVVDSEGNVTTRSAVDPNIRLMGTESQNDFAERRSSELASALNESFIQNTAQRDPARGSEETGQQASNQPNRTNPTNNPNQPNSTDKPDSTNPTNQPNSTNQSDSTPISPQNLSHEQRVQKGEQLRNAQAETVAPNTITASEGMSARKAAEKWWDENNPSPMYYDTEVGEVQINKNSVKNSLAHGYSQAKLDALTTLAGDFGNAVYLGSMPDSTRDGNVMEHYFAYPIIYDGKRHYVFCRVMQDANKNSLYVHEVFVADNIKEGDTLQTAASQPHGGITLYKGILANVLFPDANNGSARPSTSIGTGKDSETFSIVDDGGVKKMKMPSGKLVEVNSDGYPYYSKADPADAAAELLNRYKDSPDTVDRRVDTQIRAAQKQLEKAQQVKFSENEDPAIADREDKAREQAIKDAQQKLEQWNNIKSEVAKARSAQAEAEKAEQKRQLARTALENTYRQAKELGLDIAGVESLLDDSKATAETLDSMRRTVEREIQKEQDRLNSLKGLEGVPFVDEDNPEDALRRGFRNDHGTRIDRPGKTDGVYGKEATATFSYDDENQKKGRFKVIEAESLQPSHIGGQRNLFYFISKAQPKNRTDAESIASEQTSAKNIDPKLITGDGYSGVYAGSAPIVNTRGETIQGNHRGAILRTMYDSYPEAAEKYKQYLIDHASEFGIDPEEIRKMKHPAVVIEIDVPDAEAIRLGQMTARDLETGGIRNIDPEATATKLLNNKKWNFDNFLGVLLRTQDPDASIADLIVKNGPAAIKRMAETGVISDTEAVSAVDSRGNLTPEAKKALKDILLSKLFHGGTADLAEKFDGLPIKVQNAIATSFARDYKSPESERIIRDLQQAIDVLYRARQDADFAATTTLEGARGVLQRWLTERDMFTGKFNGEGLSSLAVELAARMQAGKQKEIARMLDDIFDRVQASSKTGQLSFGEQPEPVPLREAVKQVLGIDYTRQVHFKDPQIRRAVADEIVSNLKAKGADVSVIGDEGQQRLDRALADGEDGIRFSRRTKPVPTKTQKVYKLMRLGSDGKLYPLFIDSSEGIELGQWYDADSPDLSVMRKLDSGVWLIDPKTGKATSLHDYNQQHGISKDGRFPSRQAVSEAAANGQRWVSIVDKKTSQKRYGGETRSYYNLGINGAGSVGEFAMRPGWHAGSLPTMRQIGKGKGKDLRDNHFVWVEGEIPADRDYNAEAQANPDHDIPDHIPTDGYYLKSTNANSKTAQADRMGWYVAGAFKPDRIISDSEARETIDKWNSSHPDKKVEYDYRRESGEDFDGNAEEYAKKLYAQDREAEEVMRILNGESSSRQIDKENEIEPNKTDKTNKPNRIRKMQVYHGSANDFDRFDTMNHLGEGEGSQVYGAGTYVADQKNLGKKYSDIASRQKVYYKGKEVDTSEIDSPTARAATYALRYGGVKDALDWARHNRDNISDKSSKAYRTWDDAVKILENSKDGDFKIERSRYLYDIEIPEDNGKNYLDWDDRWEGSKEVADRLYNEITKNDNEDAYSSQQAKDALRKEVNDYLNSYRLYTNGDMYGTISSFLGSDRAASEFLHKLGYTGIKVHAAHNSGDARYKENWNYVIFDDKDLKINNKIKFFRTKTGEVYGFVTKEGKIYLDPKHLDPSLPIHEYGHLWAEAVRIKDPKRWAKIVKTVNDAANGQLKPLFDEVRRDDPSLTGDDLAEEVLMRYSGKKGMKLLDDAAKEIWDSGKTVDEKQIAKSAIEKVVGNLKNTIREFWKDVADMLGIKYRNVDDIADHLIYDALTAKNPREGDRITDKPDKSNPTDSTNPSDDSIKPVGNGDFGPVYDQFKGKPKEAVSFLLAKKGGEATGALRHKDIGDIDLVYGEEGSGHSDGYGLAKLAKYHPEVLDNLQEILDDMHVTKRTDNRVQLESDTHQATVRLTWNDKKETWLLTAFEKKSSAPDNTTDTAKTSQGGKGNGTATSQSTASNGKDNDIPSPGQEKQEKKHPKYQWKSFIGRNGETFDINDDIARTADENWDAAKKYLDNNPDAKVADLQRGLKIGWKAANFIHDRYVRENKDKMVSSLLDSYDTIKRNIEDLYGEEREKARERLKDVTSRLLDLGVKPDDKERRSKVADLTDEEKKVFDDKDKKDYQDIYSKTEKAAEYYRATDIKKLIASNEKKLQETTDPKQRLALRHRNDIYRAELKKREDFARKYHIANGRTTLDEVVRLFGEMNMDSSLAPVFERVVKTCRLFSPEIKFTTQLKGGTAGTAGVDGIVKYNFDFFSNPNASNQEKASVLVHELVHNATLYALEAYTHSWSDSKGLNGIPFKEIWGKLSEGQRKAVEEIYGIYSKIKYDREAFPDKKRKDGKQYGLSNAYEMVAEIYANSEFREQAKKKNLWTKLKDAIVRFFTGAEPGAEQTTVMKALSERIDYLLEHPNIEVYKDMMGHWRKRRSDVTDKIPDELNERKQQQLDIINRTNPMLDDYHVGVRSVDDILTFDEAVDYSREENVVSDGDKISAYPDVSDEMLERAQRTGMITVYSSHPIKDGVFVSPSLIMAREYAGGRGSKVYSKRVPVEDVAWLDADEGQYARVEEAPSHNSETRNGDVPEELRKRENILKEKYKDTSSRDLFVSLKDKQGEDYYDTITELARRTAKGETTIHRLGDEIEGGAHETVPEIIGRLAAGRYPQFAALSPEKSEKSWTAQRGRNGEENIGLFQDKVVSDTEKAIERWARDNGCFYEYKQLVGNSLDEGIWNDGFESETFRSKDGKYVIKATHFMPDSWGNDILHRLDQIRAGNKILPNEWIEVLGYGYDSKGRLSVITRQPLIEGKTVMEANDFNLSEGQKEIDTWLESQGFKKKIIKNPEYPEFEGYDIFTNGKFTIVDASPSNVIIDKDGKYHIIDCEVLPVGYEKIDRFEVTDVAHNETKGLADININDILNSLVHESKGKGIGRLADESRSGVAENGDQRVPQPVSADTGNRDIREEMQREAQEIRSLGNEAPEELRRSLNDRVRSEGLDKTLGHDNYNALMRGLHINLSHNQEYKDYVREHLWSNKLDVYKTAADFLAQQAGKPGKVPMWQDVQQRVNDSLKKAGIDVELGLRQTKYLAWLAQHPSDRANPLKEAERIAMERKIMSERIEQPVSDGEFRDFGTDTPETDTPKTDTPRTSPNETVPPVHEMSDEEVKAEVREDRAHVDFANPSSPVPPTATPVQHHAKSAYQRALDYANYIRKEAFIDYMQAAHELACAILGVKGSLKGLLKENEDFLSGENQLSSKEKAVGDRFRRDFMRPLMKTVRGLLPEFGGKVKEAMPLLQTYMYVKHGLERNRVLFVRDYLRELRRTESGRAEAEQKENVFNAEKARLDFLLRTDSIRLDEYYHQFDDVISSIIEKTYDASKNDYSGLSDLFDKPSADYDDLAAIDKVMATESRIGADRINEFWDSLRNVTSFGIEMQRKGGVISNELADRLHSMFQWYVPLKGFNGKTAEEAYTYSRSPSSGKLSVAPTVKNANGRKSLASLDIFAHIGSDAVAAVQHSLRNQMVNQRFLTFVRNHYDVDGEDRLVTEIKHWIVKTGVDNQGKDMWEERFPDIGEETDPDKVSQIVETFNNDMENLKTQGLAMVVDENSRVPYTPYRLSSKKDKSEHIVVAYQNGQKHLLVVNGNPRAAQAINGQLSPESAHNPVARGTHAMSQLVTTWRPLFVVRNFFRDAWFAAANNFTNEGFNYWRRYAGNYSKIASFGLLPGQSIGSLFYRYEHGTLDSKKSDDMLFKEFMDNGGETGWAGYEDVEMWTKEIAAEVKSSDGVSAKKVLMAVPKLMLAANEHAENIARFATYMTSRKMGRTITRSIADAKEVSVNFNRKGSGNKAAGFKNSKGSTKAADNAAVASHYLRNYTMFFNAGMQGLNTFAKNYRDHPVRSTVVTATFFALGAAMASLNRLFIDREDKKERGGMADPYAELPEYTRRQNLCIYAGKGNFITIPLPIELRAIYGMGDIFSSYTSHPELRSGENVALDVAEEISSISPLDFLGDDYGTPLMALVPATVKPVIEAGVPLIGGNTVFAEGLNKKWNGLQIRKNLDRNNQNEPAWQRAYSNTGDAFVDVAKWVDMVTSDNIFDWSDTSHHSAYIKGAVDLDPAQVSHLLNSYGGGLASTPINVASMVKDIMAQDNTGDKVKTAFTSHSNPLLSPLHFSPDERTRYTRTRSKWYRYQQEVYEYDAAVKGLKKDPKYKNNPLLNAKLKAMEQSKWGQRVKITKDALKLIRNNKKVANVFPENKAYYDLQNDQLIEQNVKMLDKLH